MAVDPYALCPCGSGKKLKFCCGDLAGEIEKIHRMIEGDQPRAALRHVEQSLAKNPGRASLLDLKAALELSLGEIDAAMLWSGSISQAKLNRPEAEFEMVKGFVPPSDVRWNSVWVIKAKEVELKQFIDEAFAQMTKSGEIRRLAERYGVPYFPPVQGERGADS